MIDIEDLSENDFLLACYENSKENKFIIYSWKGTSVCLDQQVYDDYLNSIKMDFFASEDIQKIKLIEEIPYNESDEFMSLL